MKAAETAIVRLGEAMGTAMWIAWAIFLGPVGFVLLLGIAYAMDVQNLALGIVCGILLFLPVVLTILWSPLGWFAVLHESQASRSRWHVPNVEVNR